VCLFVWQSIGSTPGHDRDLRPVSLEPVWLQVQTFEKNLPEKWPISAMTFCPQISNSSKVLYVI
jgi:hypothetical protein